MANKNLASVLRHYDYDGIRTEIRFEKTGSEIAISVQSVIADVQKDIAERTIKIEAICKAREVSLEEVLEGAEDHEKYMAYEYKMSSSLPTQAKGVLESLQRDLNTLKSESQAIVAGKRQIENLQRIVQNINTERAFELSYNDLVLFGF